MLTRATLDLPINPQPPSLPHAGNSGSAAQIARLESQVSFLTDQSNRLLAALQAMWNTLNRDGALAISGATIDGSIIGGAVPAAGTFTDLTSTGNNVFGNAQADTMNVGNGDIVKDATGKTGFGVTTTIPSRVSILGSNSATTNDLTFTFDASGNYRNGIAEEFSSVAASGNRLHFRISDATATGQNTILSLIGDGIAKFFGLVAAAQTAAQNMTIPDGYGVVIPGPYDAGAFTIDAGTGVFEVT